MQNTKSIDNSKYYYNPYKRSKIFPKRKYPISISNFQYFQLAHFLSKKCKIKPPKLVRRYNQR